MPLYKASVKADFSNPKQLFCVPGEQFSPDSWIWHELSDFGNHLRALAFFAKAIAIIAITPINQFVLMLDKEVPAMSFIAFEGIQA